MRIDKFNYCTNDMKLKMTVTKTETISTVDLENKGTLLYILFTSNGVCP